MKAKNKNGKKKKIQLNYEVDNMFITSIKNGQMKVIGCVDENNFSDFVNRYLTDILVPFQQNRLDWSNHISNDGWKRSRLLTMSMRRITMRVYQRFSQMNKLNISNNF